MIEQVKSVDWMARGAAFIERVPLLLLDDVKSRIVTMLDL
jgi:mRNA-degrading endonuclease toxin of MazEF toxin-antitoxin module